MLGRRGLLLALVALAAAPASARGGAVLRLDALPRGLHNRALVVSFARAHAGAVVGLTALVPMHVAAGADPDRELSYGLDTPQERVLLRISGGFALQRAVRHNQWHLERIYLVDGFFRVTDRGLASPREGRVLELVRVEPPVGAVETITDFAG